MGFLYQKLANEVLLLLTPLRFTTPGHEQHLSAQVGRRALALYAGTRTPSLEQAREAAAAGPWCALG